MAVYSFTVGTAPSSGISITRATIEAIGEELARLFGLRQTRLRSAHAAGATTLSVESVYGFSDSGRLYIEDEPDPVSYTGVVRTPAGQQFTGCTPLTVDHAEEAEVADWNRRLSKLDELRRATLVDYATGDDLDRLARDAGRDRPRQIADDDDFRRLLKVIAFLARGPIYALELVLDALFPPAAGCAGPAGWIIYESLVEYPGRVFITLPDQVGSDPNGRFFLNARDRVTSGSATSVTLSDEPRTVRSVAKRPVELSLEMAALPSAAATPWTFVAESVGVEGTYFSIVNGELHHICPAGTDSGRYRRDVPQMGNEFNVLGCSHRAMAVTTIGGRPWKLTICDGERGYTLMWTESNLWLGHPDGTIVEGPYAISPGAAFRQYRLERDGDFVRGYYEGAEVLQAAAADFNASALRYFDFGYRDNGQVNQWQVRWEKLWAYTKHGRNYWNLIGSAGSLAAGSDVLTDAAGVWVASDDEHRIWLRATENKNNGVWRVASYVGPTQLQLDGIERSDGYADSLDSDAIYSRRAIFRAEDVGKSVTVSGSAVGNDDTYPVLAVVSPYEVTVDITGHPGGLVTESAMTWKFTADFANEAGIGWELIGAGSSAGAVLTLRDALPLAATPVEVQYTTIRHGQILRNETIANDPAGTYYPAYLFGASRWIQDLLDDVVPGGVWVEFERPY